MVVFREVSLTMRVNPDTACLKAPFPLMESFTEGVLPSRLTWIVVTGGECLHSEFTNEESRRVPLVSMSTSETPLLSKYSIREKRSARRKGSPPLKAKQGATSRVLIPSRRVSAMILSWSNRRSCFSSSL